MSFASELKTHIKRGLYVSMHLQNKDVKICNSKNKKMFVNGALCKLMISVQTGNHEKKKNSKKRT